MGIWCRDELETPFLKRNWVFVFLRREKCRCLSSIWRSLGDMRGGVRHGHLKLGGVKLLLIRKEEEERPSQVEPL